MVRLQTQKAAIQSENLKMREALEKSKLTLEHHAFNEQRSRQMLQNAQAEIQQLQAMVSESNKLNAALMTKVQTLALRRDFQAPPSHMQQPFPAHTFSVDSHSLLEEKTSAWFSPQNQRSFWGCRRYRHPR